VSHETLNVNAADQCVRLAIAGGVSSVHFRKRVLGEIAGLTPHLSVVKRGLALLLRVRRATETVEVLVERK
jgi:hypothetical protein